MKYYVGIIRTKDGEREYDTVIRFKLTDADISR
jgi:hypothetical protein